VKQFARAAASFVLLAAAGVAAVRVGYEPYRCNIVARTVGARTQYLTDHHLSLDTRVITTRQNLTELAPCLAAQPHDVNLHMLAGANYSLRQEPEQALREYEAALRYDRRAEIYFNLGITLADLGRTAEAVAAIETACIAHLSYISDVPSDIQFQIGGRVEQVRRDMERRAAARGY
jgi:tetratricopeptide (TPR) repeat protein